MYSRFAGDLEHIKTKREGRKTRPVNKLSKHHTAFVLIRTPRCLGSTPFTYAVLELVLTAPEEYRVAASAIEMALPNTAWAMVGRAKGRA